MISHITCKGSTDDLHVELKKLRSGKMDHWPSEAVDFVFKYVDQYIGFTKTQPIPYNEVLYCKSTQSSPGYPWRNQFADFGEMVEHFGIDVLVDELEGFEYSLQYGFRLSPFQVFSKRDKYKPKKVMTRSFRSIQGMNLHLFFIMCRYLDEIVHLIEMLVPEFFLITTKDQYRGKVLKRFKGLHTIGVDYTAFDKNVPRELTAAVLHYLFSKTTAPQYVVDYVVNNVADPLFLLPDGSIYVTNGTNPSGQFCTSIVNSFVHFIYSLDIYSTIFSVSVAEVASKVTMVMTADDGIDGFMSLDEADLAVTNYPVLLLNRYGIEAKIDLIDGRPYSWPLLAPYLGQLLVQRCGVFFLVPLQVTRSLSHLQFWCGGFDEHLGEVCTGILESCRGFLELRLVDAVYQWPQAFQEFYDFCLEFRSVLKIHFPDLTVFGIGEFEHEVLTRKSSLIDQTVDQQSYSLQIKHEVQKKKSSLIDQTVVQQSHRMQNKIVVMPSSLKKIKVKRRRNKKNKNKNKRSASLTPNSNVVTFATEKVQPLHFEAKTHPRVSHTLETYGKQLQQYRVVERIITSNEDRFHAALYAHILNRRVAYPLPGIDNSGFASGLISSTLANQGLVGPQAVAQHFWNENNTEVKGYNKYVAFVADRIMLGRYITSRGYLSSVVPFITDANGDLDLWIGFDSSVDTYPIICIDLRRASAGLPYLRYIDWTSSPFILAKDFVSGYNKKEGSEQTKDKVETNAVEKVVCCKTCNSIQSVQPVVPSDTEIVQTQWDGANSYYIGNNTMSVSVSNPNAYLSTSFMAYDGTNKVDRFFDLPEAIFSGDYGFTDVPVSSNGCTMTYSSSMWRTLRKQRFFTDFSPEQRIQVVNVFSEILCTGSNICRLVARTTTPNMEVRLSFRCESWVGISPFAQNQAGTMPYETVPFSIPSWFRVARSAGYISDASSVQKVNSMFNQVVAAMPSSTPFQRTIASLPAAHQVPAARSVVEHTSVADIVREGMEGLGATTAAQWLWPKAMDLAKKLSTTVGQKLFGGLTRNIGRAAPIVEEVVEAAAPLLLTAL